MNSKFVNGGETLSQAAEFIKLVSGIMWSWPLIAALFGTHIYMTFRLKFIQRYTFKAIKLSVSNSDGSSGDISPFSALMTSLAATIGTGNIVGVATAIAAGGPGAVLWMWLSGILGMSTKYAESLLSVKYRIKNKDGTISGGPMYVMERALHLKGLGMFFSFCTAVAAFGVGAMVQSNSISMMFQKTFHIPSIATGAVVALLVAVVIIGGIKSIAKVCNLIIPAAGIIFIASNIAILIIGWRTLPQTIALIFTSAFNGHAALGGFAGATLKEACRFGISRGLFSNESGLGSEPIVAAAAKTENPVRQALVSYTGTFWDTVVLAAITGIMIVNSGLWVNGLNGSDLTGEVFAVLPVFGSALLSLSLFTFAFATSIGWSYYAEKAVEYLFSAKAVKPYKVLYIISIFLGSVFSLNIVWNLSDIANAFMAIPNLASVLVLSDVVVKETKQYLWSGRMFQKNKK